MSLRTVQRLCRRFEELGDQGLQPEYERCGKRQALQWKQQVAKFRREHPTWGAELIRVQLQASVGDEELPSTRTMQRWLKELELNPAPAGRRSQGPRPARLQRAARPHETWQIDAAELIRLRNGERVCWLRLTDECSGAFLKTWVFPHARWEHVDPWTIQRRLRKTFTQWGLPERAQFDNGYPWGSTGHFPPALPLWVIGLGVNVVWSWPACPQENGVVERSQGTGKRWGEPHTCRSAAELQDRLDKFDRIQREVYKYHGSTRSAVFPKLAHSGRPYVARTEQQHWQLARVLQALSERVAVARVDRHGGVSLYHYSRFIGKPYAGQPVFITLDPTGPTWVFSSKQGEQWRTHPATELTKQRIMALDISSEKGKPKPR